MSILKAEQAQGYLAQRGEFKEVLQGERNLKAIHRVVYLFLTVLFILTTFIAAQAASWKFAVWCDTRSDYTPGNTLHSTSAVSPYAQNVAAAISRESVDFVLFPGDLAVGEEDNA